MSTMKLSTVGEIAKQVAANRQKSAKEGQGKDQGKDIPDQTNKGTVAVKNDEGDTGGGPVRHFQSDAKNQDTKRDGSATAAGDTVGASDASRAMPGYDKAKDGTKSTGDGPSSFKVAADFKKRTAGILKSLQEKSAKKDEDGDDKKKDEGGDKKDGDKKDGDKDDKGEGKDGEDGDAKKANLDKVPNVPEDVARQLSESFGEDYHRKLAAAITQDEEGVKFAKTKLEEYVGATAAEQILKEAAESYQAYEQYGREMSEGEKQAQEYWNSLSHEQKKVAKEIHTRHESALQEFEYDFEKQAYAAGAQDMMGMQGGMEAGVPDEELMIPGGAEGAPTVDEIVEEIMAMIEQGLISPEEGEAMIEEIVAQDQAGMQEGAKQANEKFASVADKLLKDED